MKNKPTVCPFGEMQRVACQDTFEWAIQLVFKCIEADNKWGRHHICRIQRPARLSFNCLYKKILQNRCLSACECLRSVCCGICRQLPYETCVLRQTINREGISPVGDTAAIKAELQVLVQKKTCRIDTYLLVSAFEAFIVAFTTNCPTKLEVCKGVEHLRPLPLPGSQNSKADKCMAMAGDLWSECAL